MPVNAAALDQAISGQFLDIEQRFLKIGIVAGIITGLLATGVGLAFIPIGIKMNPRWKSVRQVWSNVHQTYDTRTSDPGHLMAVVGGMFSPVLGLGSGIIVGHATFFAALAYGHLRLPRCDPSANNQKLFEAVSRMAPHLNDSNLQRVIDGASYRDLMRLEKAVGTRRMERLVAHSQIGDATGWAWGLAASARSQTTIHALQSVLEDNAEQLVEARSAQTSGFLAHLTHLCLERSRELRASEEQLEHLQDALHDLAAHFYTREEHSSELEIQLEPSQQLTVNSALIQEHSPLIWSKAVLDDNEYIDFSEEPEEVKEGLKALLTVLQGELLLEELTWEEIVSKVYPAARHFDFQKMTAHLDRLIKEKLKFGEVSMKDLGDLNLSRSLKEHCSETIAQNFPSLTDTERMQEMFQIASCCTALRETIYAKVMEQISQENVMEWLQKVDKTAHPDLQQRLLHFATTALQEESPEGLELLPRLWNYASHEGDEELKEECIRFVASSSQDVGSLLRRTSKGIIPPELYNALTSNAHVRR